MERIELPSGHYKCPAKPLSYIGKFVELTGLEPATSTVQVWHSPKLSYSPVADKGIEPLLPG